MGIYFWLAGGVAISSFLAYRAGRIWADAGQRGFDRAGRIGWAVLGSVAPSRYWWGARIESLSPQEQAGLLACETEALGLSRADSLACPLCTAEISHAWALTSDGHPTVAPGPVECPCCDFRLDCCRHCIYFLPGNPQVWGVIGSASGDLTFGRCDRYREWQPVERACSPQVARQFKARGWERARLPARIVDSFLPPDYCTAFEVDRKRLKASEVQWPDARRVALLRLLVPVPPPAKASSEELLSDDEQWLL